jgi:hypothetical protein
MSQSTDGLKYSIHESKIRVSASSRANETERTNPTNHEAATSGDCAGSLCSNRLARSGLVQRS